MQFPGSLINRTPPAAVPRTLPAITPLYRLAGAGPRLLNLSRLPREQRAPTWQRLQAERPDQAALIASDEIKTLRAAFDAELLVEAFDD